MPINLLLHIHGDARARRQLVRELKAKISRPTKARIISARKRKTNCDCVLVEISNEGRPKTQINTLFRLLPAAKGVASNGQHKQKKPVSLKVSMAFLAVYREITVTLTPAMLRRLADSGATFEVIAFSLNKAKKYRAKFEEKS